MCYNGTCDRKGVKSENSVVDEERDKNEEQDVKEERWTCESILRCLPE